MVVRRPLMGVRAMAASRLLTLAFNRAGVGLCLVGSDNQVMLANARWLGSLGLTAERAVGRDILDLLPELDDPVARARAGEPAEFRRWRRYSDEAEVWLEGSVAPIPMGRSVGTLITTRVIPAPGPRGHEHSRVDRAREERLSHITVGIQGLVVTVQAHAEILRQAADQGEQTRGNAEAILAAVEQMDALIAELHDLTGQRGGQSRSPVDQPGLHRLVLQLRQLVPWLN